MRSSQSGFTLIELIVVIVVLGIVGVVAMARFQNLSAEAADAAIRGVASELAASTAINLGMAASGGTPAMALTADGTNCNTLGSLFASGSLPNGYTFTGTINCGAGAATGDSGGNCTITHGSTATAPVVPVLCTG